MNLPPLIIVVGAGGVGKTSLAAALALRSSGSGADTLVMTFDPSLRLKDALGVGSGALGSEVEVPVSGDGRLVASLLDARRTFDGLVQRYAPSASSRRRILENRFYQRLGGSLAGIMEYMAVERLYEAASEGRYRRIVLDTPPTSQALDFLEAPSRIVSFLDSGFLRLALRPWFDSGGRLKLPAGLGRRVERYLDELVGVDLLREMVEFFDAFSPLYAGFRQRASEVEELLASERCLFVLVVGPGEGRVADALFFARRLEEAGYRLGPTVVNRLHPAPEEGVPTGRPDPVQGDELIRWLGARDQRGVESLRDLLGSGRSVITVPLLPTEPTDLESLSRLGELAFSAVA